jgi:hypothetical protein
MKTLNGLIIIIFVSVVFLGVLYFQEDFPEMNISNIEKRLIKEEVVQEIEKNPVSEKQFNIHLSSEILKQSDTLLIRVDNIDKIEGSLVSKKIGFVKIKDSWFGFVGISVSMEPGIYNLKINDEIRKIKVVEKDFPITELIITDELEKEGYTPSTISDNIIKENAMIKDVLDVYTNIAYFNESFGYPLENNIVVGKYGSIRKSGDYYAQHLGVDLDADMNTEVYAVNDGKVVFTKELTNYGRTVIIDHGLGIYSLYLHLETFKVLEGDKVEKGNIIGLSGNTGYSIAPHLHFSIKLNGSSVDPLNFIETTKQEIAWK